MSQSVADAPSFTAMNQITIITCLICIDRLIGKNNLNIVRSDALNYKNSPNSTNKSRDLLVPPTQSARAAADRMGRCRVGDDDDRSGDIHDIKNNR